MFLPDREVKFFADKGGAGGYDPRGISPERQRIGRREEGLTLLTSHPDRTAHQRGESTHIVIGISQNQLILNIVTGFQTLAEERT